MSRCFLPVLAKRVATQSVILAVRRSSRGFLFISEPAVCCIQLVIAQSLTGNVWYQLGKALREVKIFPELREAGVFW